MFHSRATNSFQDPVRLLGCPLRLGENMAVRLPKIVRRVRLASGSNLGRHTPGGDGRVVYQRALPSLVLNCIYSPILHRRSIGSFSEALLAGRTRTVGISLASWQYAYCFCRSRQSCCYILRLSWCARLGSSVPTALHSNQMSALGYSQNNYGQLREPSRERIPAHGGAPG